MNVFIDTCLFLFYISLFVALLLIAFVLFVPILLIIGLIIGIVGLVGVCLELFFK